MTMTEQKEGLPKGKYTFVGIDVDATGRRILDEIVHLAAYTPTDEYDQYIIPVMNLNPAARQRHQLRVITVGFFRMLKSMLGNTVVKSKTEIVALKSFLDWLEERKANDNDSKGIILIYHEPIKFIPYMLLEAYKRYDLLERFRSVVAGFVDGQTLTEAKCASTCKTSSLRELAKMFVDYKEDDDMKNFEGNASVRARLAYQVIQHLVKAEKEDVDDIGNLTIDSVNDFVKTVDDELNELSNQKRCMDLQHTFRPIFVQYFKTNLYHRYKAVTFRRVLAEQGFELKTLEEIWTEKKKEGLTEIVSKLDEIKEEDREELVDILDKYFDPEKEAAAPAVSKQKTRVRRRSYRKGSDKENRKPRNANNNNNDGESNGEHTSSETRSPRKNRRSRRRISGGKRDSSKTKVEDDAKITAVTERLDQLAIQVAVN